MTVGLPCAGSNVTLAGDQTRQMNRDSRNLRQWLLDNRRLREGDGYLGGRLNSRDLAVNRRSKGAPYRHPKGAPFERPVLALALAASEPVGVGETVRVACGALGVFA